MTLKKENKKNKNKTKTLKWSEFLFDELKNPCRASGYLSECFKDGPETFLLGLRYVVEAHGGIGTLANKTGLGRESLYKLLSGNQGGRLSSLMIILNALGVNVFFEFLGQTNRSKSKNRERLVGNKAA